MPERALISVVVPAYNEELVIAETHRRLTAVCEACGSDYELIYVNDGSRDGTGEILRELAGRDKHV